MTNDQTVSGTAVRRTNNEIIEYLKDANDQVDNDYYEYSAYTISGSSITPAPDNTDRRLLSLKAAEFITHDDYREFSGDAILIKTGSISLDTSKGGKFFADNLNYIRQAYDSLIMNLEIHGKSASTEAIGTRIDNYKSRSTDVKVSDSIL